MPPTLSLFAQAMLIGLSIAAPVGQIGVLAIQRTLQHGPAAGIATGLGAAVADAAYGAIGAFGVTAVIDALTGARVPLMLGGAVFLTVLAVRTWRRAPSAGGRAAGRPAASLLQDFASTVLLTLANPSTIVSFVAVFGLLAGRTGTHASPWVLVAGVFTGSALWWLVLAVAVGRLRSRFDQAWQRRVNRLSALVLGVFALAGAVAAWRGT